MSEWRRCTASFLWLLPRDRRSSAAVGRSDRAERPTHDATAIAIDAPSSLTGRPTAGLTCVLEQKASAGLARGRERAVTSCGLVERCEPVTVNLSASGRGAGGSLDPASRPPVDPPTDGNTAAGMGPRGRGGASCSAPRCRTLPQLRLSVNSIRHAFRALAGVRGGGPDGGWSSPQPGTVCAAP